MTLGRQECTPGRSPAGDARPPDRDYPGAEVASTKDIVRLLAMIKGDAELCVLVRGDLRDLQLRRLRVISLNGARADHKTFFFLPSNTSLVPCINIVVYLADARHLMSTFGVRSLAGKVVHLAAEMRRLIGAASTLIVCVVHDEDCPPSEVDLPKGFPLDLDSESAFTPPSPAHADVVDDVVVFRIDANSPDPISELATRIGLLVKLSDQQRSITQSTRGLYTSRSVIRTLTPRTISWIFRRVAPTPDAAGPSGNNEP